MKSKSESEKHERQDWLIVLLILLLGFLCVALAGQWALRLSPSWNLNTDMGSNIDPNSDFLTKPVQFFEPLDPGILTQPAWVQVFLTPGATFTTGTPPPPGQANNVPTRETTSMPVTAAVTVSVPTTAVPTNTFVWLPQPPSITPKHGGGPAPDTAVPPPGPVNADVQVTIVDGQSFYVIGAPMVYTVTVTNIGPDPITGVIVTAGRPNQVSSWDWACSGAVNGATGCTSLNTGGPFSDTINLPLNGSIVYTVTATVPGAVLGDLTNKVNVTTPLGTGDPGGNNMATDTNNLTADLQIVKTNTADTYAPGGTLTYTVTVSNAGPNAVNGAVVHDALIAGMIDSWQWDCFAVNGGANGCDAMPDAGSDFNDTVNLPNGGSIQYQVTARVSAGASGGLTNQATVSVPVAGPTGYTDAAGNNLASHMDPLFVVPGPPPPGVDTYDNSSDYCLTAGNPSITFTVSAAIDDDGIPDLIYYEEPQTLPTPPFPLGTSGILMDKVFIEISDGFNWYPLFNWGDNAANNNAPNLVASPCGTETDNCPIPAGSGLINDTGILLNIPASLQNGLTSYIRITLLPEGPPDDGNVCIDGIVPY